MPNTRAGWGVMRLAAHAMGTRFELLLGGENTPGVRAAGEEALRAVEDWHRRLSRFEPASEISRINREAGVHPVRVEAEVFDLLYLCRSAWRATGGLFDPAAGSGNSFDTVELDQGAGTVRFADDRTLLDLGGIAKGFALDISAKTLTDSGISTALMHGGTSSVLALGGVADTDGKPGTTRHWGVRIAGDSGTLDARLHDAVMSVSAPRGRVQDGRGHIIDPRTGNAAQQGRTAAVICSLAHGPFAGAWCEAWSTALCIAEDSSAAAPEGFGVAVERGGAWCVLGETDFFHRHIHGGRAPAEMEVG